MRIAVRRFRPRRRAETARPACRAQHVEGCEKFQTTRATDEIHAAMSPIRSKMEPMTRPRSSMPSRCARARLRAWRCATKGRTTRSRILDGMPHKDGMWKGATVHAKRCLRPNPTSTRPSPARRCTATLHWDFAPPFPIHPIP